MGFKSPLCLWCAHNSKVQKTEAPVHQNVLRGQKLHRVLLMYEENWKMVSKLIRANRSKGRHFSVCLSSTPACCCCLVSIMLNKGWKFREGERERGFVFCIDIRGGSLPPLRCMDKVHMSENEICHVDETEASTPICFKPSRGFCRMLSWAGRLSQQGSPGAPLSLLAFSSLLPTRLTPKVALIGMGSDSYPECLWNF